MFEDSFHLSLKLIIIIIINCNCVIFVFPTTGETRNIIANMSLDFDSAALQVQHEDEEYDQEDYAREQEVKTKSCQNFMFLILSPPPNFPFFLCWGR